MKLKNIMYTETLIAYGAPRSRSNLKHKTIHVWKWFLNLNNIFIYENLMMPLRLKNYW
jgi:hypothetical protein